MKRVFSMILGLAVALSALQAQNTVTVGNVSLQEGETAVVSVELTNELEFSAFQMDLKLPEGFSVATMVNEDGDEVLDITLNADRKKSTHLLAYNVLGDGTVRIASYSSTNATYKGTSGEIVQIRILPAAEAVSGNHLVELSKILFTTPEPAVEYNLGTVSFKIKYSRPLLDAVNAFKDNYTELALLAETYSSMWSIPAVNEKFLVVQEKAYEMYETLSDISVDSLETYISVMREAIAYVKAMDAKYNKWKDLLYVCYDCQDNTPTATPEVAAAFAEVVDKNSAYQWNMPAATTAEIDVMIAELDAAYRAFVKATTPKERYDVTVDIIGGGSVVGSGNYEEGTEVTLTATPNSGYRFARWSNGSTANPYVFTASRDMHLTAEFEEIPNPGVMLIPFGQFTRQPYPVKYFKAEMDSGIAPAEDWYTPDFDDSSWTSGLAPITNADHKFYTATPWEPLKSTYWVRRTFELDSIPQDRAFVLYLSHDDECTMYLNGQLIYETRGWTETYKVIPLDWKFAAYLVEGENVITAVVSNSALNHACVDFGIYHTEMDEEIVHPNRSVAVYAGQYGRCILDGNVIEPNDSYTLSNAIEDGSAIKLYFVPFDGYTARSMKRNGEEVSIKDNVYEEIAKEDVAFTDINYVASAAADTVVVTETIVDTLVVTETIVDTLVVTETVVDTLVVTETIVDTLVLTEIITKVDTMLVEKTDTVFITEIEELPTPVITCDNGVVTITCEQEDAIILYAINGDPIEGSVYTAPFEVAEDAVVSAIAVRSSGKAELSVTGTGVAQSQMRVVSRRYFAENGVEVTSPEAGVTIVVAEYEDGTTQVYKLVKR